MQLLSGIVQGLVGFGFIPAAFKDSTGDTMGGFGSSIALERGSWEAKKGKFTGVLNAHPDRGFNVSVLPLVSLFIRLSLMIKMIGIVP